MPFNKGRRIHDKKMIYVFSDLSIVKSSRRTVAFQQSSKRTKHFHGETNNAYSNKLKKNKINFKVIEEEMKTVRARKVKEDVDL